MRLWIAQASLTELMIYLGRRSLREPIERKIPRLAMCGCTRSSTTAIAQAQFCEGSARVYTRRGNDWAARMPTIPASLTALPVKQRHPRWRAGRDGASGVLRAAAEPHGQADARQRPARLLRIRSVVPRRLRPAGAALIDRKRVLEALLDDTSGVQLIRYVDHIGGDGELVLEHACKLGLEGIVSKRADARYHSGRSTDWLKTKCAAWKEANCDRFEKMGKR
jgi:bifunctional non-homologous end joining protein LigD